MQGSMFFSGKINEALKESFTEFQQDALNRFKVNVRRTRAAQLRQLLSKPEMMDLKKFQFEVWNIETKTYLRSHNIELRIFDKPFAFRVLDEVKKYVALAINIGCDWQGALDEQIVQKILPKCKGADLRVGDALKTLEEILPAAAYPLSNAKAQYMLEGFVNHGIASYF
ncbi:MAG: hypothetical protein ACRDIV_25030 [Ktedonobacteraceae bacterium]